MLCSARFLIVVFVITLFGKRELVAFAFRWFVALSILCYLLLLLVPLVLFSVLKSLHGHLYYFATLGRYSSILCNENDLWDFLFATLDKNKSRMKWGLHQQKKKYSKKKYSLQVDPFQKGAKTILKTLRPCKIIKFSTIKWFNIYYVA